MACGDPSQVQRKEAGPTPWEEWSSGVATLPAGSHPPSPEQVTWVAAQDT